VNVKKMYDEKAKVHDGASWKRQQLLRRSKDNERGSSEREDGEGWW